MSVKDIAKLGKLLGQFLQRFACCFARPAGRALLQIYVKGLLSDVQRKNAEAIALDQNVSKCCEIAVSRSWPPNTLTPKPSAASMRRELPKAVAKQQVSNGSTMGIEERSKTVSTTSRWRIRLPDLTACSMRGCTCLVNGRTTLRAVKKLRA
jgi:hypothetical protein